MEEEFFRADRYYKCTSYSSQFRECACNRNLAAKKRRESSCNEKLRDFKSSTNAIRVDKSRRMSWAGHVAQPEEQKHAHAVLRGSPTERDRLENTGVHWKRALKWILKEWGGRKRMVQDRVK